MTAPSGQPGGEFFCEWRGVAKRTTTPAAKPEAPEMPGFISLQLATLKTKAPWGPPWIHEIKYDGYRVQLRIDGDDRRAFTRNGYDWVSKFSRIAGAFDVEGQAIVDGEVVVIHEGRTNFSESAGGPGQRRSGSLALLRIRSAVAGRQRSAQGPADRAEEAAQGADGGARTQGARPLQRAPRRRRSGAVRCRQEAELRRHRLQAVDAPYRSDRVEAWQKIKVVQKGKFPVVGFIKDPSGVAALYLGRKEGKDLVCMTKVGTGWSRRRQRRYARRSTPS